MQHMGMINMASISLSHTIMIEVLELFYKDVHQPVILSHLDIFFVVTNHS